MESARTAVRPYAIHAGKQTAQRQAAAAVMSPAVMHPAATHPGIPPGDMARAHIIHRKIIPAAREQVQVLIMEKAAAIVNERTCPSLGPPVAWLAR